MKRKAFLISLSLVMLGVLFMAGCGGSASPDTVADHDEQPAEEPEEIKTIRMAVLPYFDYTLFVAAKELGLDKEQGLDLELVPFPNESQAVQALINGAIDVAQGALGSFVPLLPEADNLRIVLNNDQFKGFVYIGREGEFKSFEEFMAENNDDFEAAQAATLQQLEGKTFTLVESQFASMLSSALEIVGLTYEDVDVMNFQNDAQAALAFMRGEGDLYTGSVPQQMKILKEPGYVAVAGNEVLGTAGLWFSNTAVTEEYLNDNRDVVDKLAAIHYRMTRYLEESPDAALQPMLDYLEANASSDLTMEDAKQMIAEFVAFDTIEKSQEGVYEADSPIYWRKAAELFVEENVALEKIEEGSVDIDEVVLQEQIFNDLLDNKELMDWINSPIE